MHTQANVSASGAVVDVTPEVVTAVLRELAAEFEGIAYDGDAAVEMHLRLGGRALAAANLARRLARNHDSQQSLLAFYAQHTRSVYPMLSIGIEAAGLSALADGLANGSLRVPTEAERDYVFDKIAAVDHVDASEIAAWAAVARCACWLSWCATTSEDPDGDPFDNNSAAEDCARALAAAFTRDLPKMGDDFLRELSAFVSAKLAEQSKPAAKKRGSRRVA